MYYRDLTPYEYSKWDAIEGTQNIGWLEISKPFNKGVVSKSFIDRLFKLCAISIGQTRGFHSCQWCNEAPIFYEQEGLRLKLGAAEIRVFSNSDEIYAAPDLILHYVANHDYLPPSEFIDAVENGPIPPQREYFDLLNKHSLEYKPCLQGS